MDLKLSLPGLTPNTSTCVEPNPSKVEKWLSELPMLNVEETSQELQNSLMSSNRCPLDESKRIKFLDLYREPVKLITDKLYKGYAGLSLPLSDRHQMAAEQVRHFQAEMAIGYKRIIDDTYTRKKEKLSSRQTSGLALPIQRAISYLTASLVHSYQQYAPYPAGTWREIHLLYEFAELHGITELPVKDPLNDAIDHSSISHTYKQALLVDLADPYHLPAQMISKIYRYLDVMAPLAHLHRPPITAVADNCQFLVDLNSDRAGHMVMGQNDQLDAAHLRLLNTVDLARTIHGQLTQLKKGQSPDPQGLEDDFFDTMAHNMCRRLINSWGINPKRLFKRIPKSDIHITTAIGLEAVVYVLNRKREFLTSAEFMGPTPQRTRIGTFFARPDADLIDEDSEEQLENDKDYRLFTWDMIDESAGGMALEKRGPITGIRVGEVIATRTVKKNEDWSVSVVRWMRRVANEHTEIGIQRLTPTARPLAIKTLGQQNKESDFMPGLLLPEIPALRQPESLLTPRGVFRDDEAIYIDDSKMLQRVTGTQLIEVTGSYERFKFKLPEF
ncbi:MAG: hypothetical protein BMS9Abin33_0350 [Gammaproteobacteria bacterium]|nr:MAG: hypothetical protein BMS9Abin33_0350 [Gammaproteobacteria bacterium]